MLTDLTRIEVVDHEFAANNADYARADLHAKIDALTPDQLLIAWCVVMDMADSAQPAQA